MAVRALNEQVEGEEPFHFETAEKFFGKIYRKFIKENPIPIEPMDATESEKGGPK